ncbi:biotin/lipoyl-containing protein, partial [Streptomyces sp. NPDC086554]|uniref:biotin/lipoyl-containing protein n=1 Tax=Streptomyces sp. NPDC086554 TaxID=3154864 RepID=UPI00342524E7
MAVSVSLPALGESVTEGTVTRWLKAEGERVEADEPLLEVSTDKVDTEIPSPASGVLASIKVAEDETVEVGAELAVIDDGSGAPAAAPAPAAEPAPAAAPAPAAEAPAAPAPAAEAPAPAAAPAGGATRTDGTQPPRGESVTDGTGHRRRKAEGEYVAGDQPQLP